MNVVAIGSASRVPVKRQEFPLDGTGTNKLTLPAMCGYIREGGRDERMKQFAEMVVRKVYAPSSTITDREAAQVLLDYVRANVRYRPDPPLTEMVQDPRITLCVEGAAICIPVEDCDGLVCALGALMFAFGIDVKILKQRYGGGQQDHVLLLFKDDASGQWLTADPSSKTSPIGERLSSIEDTEVDPLSNADVGAGASHEAEFIGVGRLPVGVGRLPRSAMLRPKSSEVVLVQRRVGAGAGASFLGGWAEEATVDAFDTQLGAAIQSYDAAFQACPAWVSDTSAVNAWGGVKAAYQIQHAHFLSVKNASILVWDPPGKLIEYNNVLEAEYTTSSQVEFWAGYAQGKGCTNIPDPKGTLPQPPQAPPGGQATGLINVLKDFAMITGTVVGIGVGGYAAFKLVEYLAARSMVAK